jgi:hypothetical protein
MLRSVRSAKSVEWISENVAGVSIFFFFPSLVVSFTSGDEFHSLKTTP